MNAEVHARMSCKAAKTESPKDFDYLYSLHDFMDCSKEVEPSNLHRFLTHHLWFIKRVVIPIFGHTYICENGNKVNAKDEMEQRHCLADFRGSFIPSLADYVSLIAPAESDAQLFKDFAAEYPELFQDKAISELMLSPFHNTGMLTGLFLTHNTWFVGEILPRLFPKIRVEIKDARRFSPSVFFNRMEFAGWIDNGKGLPPSAQKITKYRQSKKEIRIDNFFKLPQAPIFDDQKVDFPRTPGLID